jgi:hypothetical protein
VYAISHPVENFPDVNKNKEKKKKKKTDIAMEVSPSQKNQVERKGQNGVC